MGKGLVKPDNWSSTQGIHMTREPTPGYSLTSTCAPWQVSTPTHIKGLTGVSLVTHGKVTGTNSTNLCPSHVTWHRSPYIHTMLINTQ